MAGGSATGLGPEDCSSVGAGRITNGTAVSDPRIGSAIPGNDIMGAKWRISGVAPKSRSVALKDHYAKMEDPIAYMILALPDLKDVPDFMPPQLKSDLGLDWNKASKGW